MVKSFKDLLALLKEIKAILVFFGFTGVTFIEYRDQALYYMHTYQLHYIIMFLITAYYIAISKKYTNDRIDKLSLYVESIDKKQQIKDLKTKVLSAYKEYGNKTIEDKLVADYLMDLENDRVELKVNSFTQGQLTKMISNIDYNKIKSY